MTPASHKSTLRGNATALASRPGRAALDNNEIAIAALSGTKPIAVPQRLAREIPCFFASVAGQFVGGGSSGVCGAAEEVGEQLEFGVAVFGADLVHRGVHP